MYCAIIEMHSQREGNRSMIENTQLFYFVSIVEYGTISKAAQQRLVSQPALTRSLQKLEDELEVELFDRKKNQIILNENGQLAYQHAKKILDMEKNMKLDVQNFYQSKQIISIGSLAPAPICGLKYLIKKNYPKMKIKEDLKNRVDDLLIGLENYQYNIIVLHYPIKDPRYECIELFDEHLYISLPPTHPLASLKEISFADLNGESILILSKIGFWNDITLKYIPDSHLLYQDDEQVFNEIKKSSALPVFKTNISLQRIEDPHRIPIPITDPEVHLTFYAIYKKENHKHFDFLKNDLSIDWKNT